MAGNLYALLVGINQYSSTGGIPALRGCVADVTAMRSFLIERLGTPELHIRLLTDTQATRAAIIDGWRTHMRNQAGAGDLVLFHYSGHGSQALSSDPGEPDGYDESLIAYDSRDPGQYDLLDKELAALIRAVEQKGAEVALILDCCHAGHLTRARGVDRPLARQAPPDTRSRPPETVLTELAATRSGNVASEYVLLAACRDEELANEYRAPVQQQWHGALTHFVLQALHTYHSDMTWGDLHDRVHAQVRAIYAHQSPQLEGPAHRKLFGGVAPPVAGYWIIIESVGERVKINGGGALGLNEGSRLAIYPPGSQVVGPPQGAATVDEVADDHAWATLDRPALVAQGSRAKLVAPGFGDQQAVVAVDDLAVRTAISTVNQGQPSAFLRVVALVEAGDGADYCVVEAEGLFQVQNVLGEPLVEAPGGAPQVATVLEHLTIFRNVQRLRNPAAPVALRDAIAVVDIAPSEQRGQEITVTPGQRLAFRLHNRSRQPLYVTVLHLGADHAIRRIYPSRGPTEKLAPGNRSLPISVVATTGATGYQPREQIKIFVTSIPMSFDALQLPPLNQGELHPPSTVRDASPLGWLLHAIRHTGTRPIRPVAAGADETWSVSDLTLVVKAEAFDRTA